MYAEKHEAAIYIFYSHIQDISNCLHMSTILHWEGTSPMCMEICVWLIIWWLVFEIQPIELFSALCVAIHLLQHSL